MTMTITMTMAILVSHNNAEKHIDDTQVKMFLVIIKNVSGVLVPPGLQVNSLTMAVIAPPLYLSGCNHNHEHLSPFGKKWLDFVVVNKTSIFLQMPICSVASICSVRLGQHLGWLLFQVRVIVVTITMIVLIKKRHNNLLISGCFVLNTHTVFVLLVLDFNIYDSFHLNFSVSWAQHYSTQPTGEPTPQALFRFCKNLSCHHFLL